MAEPLTDHQNDHVTITNRLVGNGGTHLAGAIGVFAGAANYEIAYNDICGNFSAEYGGGISHYGYSPNGPIHHNRVYFNRSYDEGGGIMVAGELPAVAGALSPGAGPVDIYANLIQGNLSNDDGGGLRFLMAGNYRFRVYNNIIANNVSTHEGGGVSINDAPDVRFDENTIVKNITTATAMTSNGLPAPAGLSTSHNSVMLQATLPGGSPSSATRSCSTTCFGTTAPAPGPAAAWRASAKWAIRAHLPLGPSVSLAARAAESDRLAAPDAPRRGRSVQPRR